MLGAIGLLFVIIFGFQVFKGNMIKKHISALGSAPISVSAIKATQQEWPSTLSATGSLRAVQGISVTTEMAGLIRDIYFSPGLEASAELAEITYERDKAQFAIDAISKETVDTDEANVKNQRALVEQQKALIEKKTIRAPFAGKLGISQVYRGQYLNTGDPVVTLQALDPIFVDFYIPEQQLLNVALGQTVTMTTDSFPTRTFSGKITTINPIIDVSTRNVIIEATIDNPDKELLPGMFARVEVITGSPQEFLTLPQTAISYNPYGNIIYQIMKDGKDHNKLIAKQKFVILGNTRGDQIQVLEGIKAGEVIVTSGQVKLKNNATVIINNNVVPSNDAKPHMVDQ
jgi:membrane fusion protein (multidrug efflux system)